jgi:hypothetical protein
VRADHFDLLVSAIVGKGNTFVYWRVHRSRSTPVVFATMSPRRITQEER